MCLKILKISRCLNNNMNDENEITSLIKNRNDMYLSLYNLEEKIKLTKTDITDINKKLKTLCEHDWSSLNSGGPYSEPYYICKICSISKY